MSEQVYYKVVRVEPSGLYSAFVGGRCAIKYAPGERAESPNGPLLVFDSLRWAEFFRDFHCGEYAQIWECVVGLTRQVAHLLRFFDSFDPREQIRQFWAGDNPLSSNIATAPNGTVACDWVKLTRMVEV